MAVTAAAEALAGRLLALGLLPAEAATDALHIAVAAVHQADYLLTWNCRHLANPALRHRLQHALEAAGSGCPVVCTPVEPMEV